MRVEYINPFIQAATNTLKELIPNMTFERGQLSTSDSPIFCGGCASVIGITGQVEGRVIFDMTKDAAIKIAGGMNEEEFAEFDSMVSSSINELANIISGGAITILNNNGYELDISAPTVFTGESLELYDPQTLGASIIVPINTNFGELKINVAMRDN
jgi:chemotaxis protein CheX